MCGLHVVRKGHGHQAIYNFVEEADGPQIVFLQGSACLTETAMKRYLDLSERLELPERPPKYRKDKRIIGKH